MRYDRSVIRTTHGRAALIFIFITVMLDMLALGMIIPVLPKLIEQFQGGDTASALGVVLSARSGRPCSSGRAGARRCRITRRLPSCRCPLRPA
jgi:hypothetical protein